MPTELCMECGSVEVRMKVCPDCYAALLGVEKEKNILINLLEKMELAYCAGDDCPYIKEIQEILTAHYKKREKGWRINFDKPAIIGIDSAKEGEP